MKWRYLVNKAMYQIGFVRESRMLAKESEITSLRHTITCRDNTIQQLKDRNKQLKKAKGEEYPDLKPLNVKKLNAWAKRVKERDGKCLACGDFTNLTAHHIYNKKVHRTLAYTDSNGVTLCSDCHRELHKKYGQGSTKENLDVFLGYKEGELNLYGVGV